MKIVYIVFEIFDIFSDLRSIIFYENNDDNIGRQPLLCCTLILDAVSEGQNL